MNLLLHCTCVLPGKFLNGSFNHTEYDFAHGVVITVNSGMKPFLCKWWNDHFKNIENMNNKSVFKNKEKNKPYYRKQHSPVHIEVVQTKPQGRYCTHSHNTILNIVCFYSTLQHSYPQGPSGVWPSNLLTQKRRLSNQRTGFSTVLYS